MRFSFRSAVPSCSITLIAASALNGVHAASDMKPLGHVKGLLSSEPDAPRYSIDR